MTPPDHIAPRPSTPSDTQRNLAVMRHADEVVAAHTTPGGRQATSLASYTGEEPVTSLVGTAPGPTHALCCSPLEPHLDRLAVILPFHDRCMPQHS